MKIKKRKTKIEYQIIIENKKKQIEEKPQHKIREEENMIMENEPKRFENLKKSEEKKELEDEKQNSEMKESDELYKINEIENRKEIEEEMEEKVKEEKTDKSQKEKNKIQEFNKPIPYQELQAEPSEDNNSQFMDEDGNIYNFDDLTEEEKMSILQQQILLQRLQEEAEARGEHFDPREYLAYLEQQAEEEEMLQKQESNKIGILSLNKELQDKNIEYRKKLEYLEKLKLSKTINLKKRSPSINLRLSNRFKK